MLSAAETPQCGRKRFIGELSLYGFAAVPDLGMCSLDT